MVIYMKGNIKPTNSFLNAYLKTPETPSSINPTSLGIGKNTGSFTSSEPFSKVAEMRTRESLGGFSIDMLQNTGGQSGGSISLGNINFSGKRGRKPKNIKLNF
jgi:hypothetical protein